MSMGMAGPQISNGLLGIVDTKERKLMEGGVWQVPKEQRPKGWENMGGIESVEKHATTTVARDASGNLLLVDAQPQGPRVVAVPVAGDGLTDWTELKKACLELRDGEQVYVESNLSSFQFGTFLNRVRSVLLNSKDTCGIRWQVTQRDRKVLVKRVTSWKDARSGGGADLRVSQPATTLLPQKSPLITKDEEPTQESPDSEFVAPKKESKFLNDLMDDLSSHPAVPTPTTTKSLPPSQSIIDRCRVRAAELEKLLESAVGWQAEYAHLKGFLAVADQMEDYLNAH